EGKQQRAVVDTYRGKSWQIGWRCSQQTSQSPRCERPCGQATKQGEQQTLGCELSDDPSATGAESDTYSHLFLPRSRAREEQVSHIAAGDQQCHSDGAEQHP